MSEELLSYAEVEETLESILVNKTLVEVESLGGPKFVLFGHPSIEETIFSRQVRKRALFEARQEGLPSKEDIEGFITDKKILTPSDQSDIKDLEEKIIGQKRLLQITRI